MLGTQLLTVLSTSVLSMRYYQGLRVNLCLHIKIIQMMKYKRMWELDPDDPKYIAAAQAFVNSIDDIDEPASDVSSNEAELQSPNMTQASLIKDSSKLIASSLRDPMRELISDQLGPVKNTLNSLLIKLQSKW